MENDDEMRPEADAFSGTPEAGNESRKAEVRLFLNDELVPLEQSKRVKTYNLEHEYAKTRKNKSPFILLTLGACVLVVGLITVAVYAKLSAQNRKIAVNSAVFNDLDLRSLMDTRSHAEMGYQVARNERERLESERSFRLRQAELDRDSRLYLIDSLRLDEGAAERRQGVAQDYARQTRAIRAELDARIKKAVADEDEAKRKLDSTPIVSLDKVDFSSQVQAHERELLMSSYQATIDRLNERLRSLQRAQYNAQREAVSNLAAKYQAEVDSLDPVLNDLRAEGLVKAWGGDSAVNFNLPSYANLLAPEDQTADFASGLRAAQQSYEDYAYLHQFSLSLPQRHTIKDYQATEEKLVAQMGAEAGKAFSSQIEKLEELRAEFKSEKEALESQLAEITAERDIAQADRDRLQAHDKQLTEQGTLMSANLAAYESWLGQVAAADQADGFVLSVSAAEGIKAYAIKAVRDAIAQTPDGISVSVYRGKKPKLATGTLSLKNGVVILSLADPALTQKIQAGDRIVR
jgi:hypothetical protein